MRIWHENHCEWIEAGVSDMKDIASVMGGSDGDIKCTVGGMKGK